MTIRFFFDLVNGGETLRDEEGVLAPTVTLAVRLAREGVRGGRMAGQLAGVEAGWSLRIRDDRDVIWRDIRIT